MAKTWKIRQSVLSAFEEQPWGPSRITEIVITTSDDLPPSASNIITGDVSKSYFKIRGVAVDLQIDNATANNITESNGVLTAASGVGNILQLSHNSESNYSFSISSTGAMSQNDPMFSWQGQITLPAAIGDFLNTSTVLPTEGANAPVIIRGKVIGTLAVDPRASGVTYNGTHLPAGSILRNINGGQKFLAGGASATDFTAIEITPKVGWNFTVAGNVAWSMLQDS